MNDKFHIEENLKIAKNNSKPLYSIRQDHINIIEQIEENEGFLTPEIEQALQLTEQEFENKAISYAYVVKGFDDTEEAIEREIERLHHLKEMAAKRKELFKRILSEAMHQFGVEKIKTATLSLSFRKSESVQITDERDIPGEYKSERIVESISKTDIKEAIKKGIAVPGAELKTNYNLQIK